MALSTIQRPLLDALLDARYSQLVALAEGWIAAGATGFGICRDGQPLVAWPERCDLERPSIIAPIQIESDVIGDLRVVGVSGDALDAQLAADAAFVSDMARLEDELQYVAADLFDTHELLLALYALGQMARGQTNLKALLTCLIAEAVRLVRAQGGFAVCVPLAQAPILAQYPDQQLDEPQAWRCFWQAQSQTRHLLSSADPTGGSTPNVDNMLYIPFQTRGVIMAGLGLLNKRGGEFDARDVRLAQLAVDQVSAQIENLLLQQENAAQSALTRDLEQARRIQSYLQPQQLPRVDGLELFAHSRPAMQLGGDLYDCISRPDKPLMVAVGDVTGKGLPAALLMAMVRTSVHSKACFMPSPTPADVIRNAHADLYDHFTQVGMFATLFVGQFDPAERRLIYANAGHSPAIYRRAGGAACLLPADSTAVGMFADSHCVNQALPFDPGDVLVIATDGFCEARNTGDELFGYDRLLQLVDLVADRSASEIAYALYQAIDQFRAGLAQDDDQTIVVIKGVSV